MSGNLMWIWANWPYSAQESPWCRVGFTAYLAVGGLFYRWTNWVWEITGWSSRFHEIYTTKIYKENQKLTASNLLSLKTLGNSTDDAQNLPGHYLRQPHVKKMHLDCMVTCQNYLAIFKACKFASSYYTCTKLLWITLSLGFLYKLALTRFKITLLMSSFLKLFMQSGIWHV